MTGQPVPDGWQQVGKISHDINNVVTVITGLCDLLLVDHADDASLAEDLKEIKENAVRAGELSVRLRELARAAGEGAAPD